MEEKMCDVCGTFSNNLIELKQDASCLFPHGARLPVPAWSFVCPGHRPIGFLEYATLYPPRVNYGRRRGDLRGKAA